MNKEISFDTARIQELERVQDELKKKVTSLGSSLAELVSINRTISEEFNKFRTIVLGLHNFIDEKFEAYGKPYANQTTEAKENNIVNLEAFVANEEKPKE